MTLFRPIEIALKFTAAVSLVVATFYLAGCKSPEVPCCKPVSVVTSPVTNDVPTGEQNPSAHRYTYVPRVYPVDDRGFSPVDKALQKAYAPTQPERVICLPAPAKIETTVG